MRVREWIITNFEGNNRIYTSPDAPRSVAFRKLQFRFKGAQKLLCFVGLKKGKIVEK